MPEGRTFTVRELTCLRCKNTWFSAKRDGTLPVCCARCKSPEWDKPYKRIPRCGEAISDDPFDGLCELPRAHEGDHNRRIPASKKVVEEPAV